MEKSDFKPHGEALETIISISEGDVTQYYTVVCDGFFVGVGIFHNHSEQCTFAIVKDEDGEMRLIGMVLEKSQLANGELDTLMHYFKEMFPD